MAFSESISRRSLIAASALPVAAVLPVVAAANPDAELLRLDAELERTWKANQDLYDPFTAAVEAAEEEIRERAGRSLRADITLSQEEWQRWWNISEQVRAERNIPAIARTKADALAALEETERRIFAIDPTTVAGFAVWARAIATNRSELWECDDNDPADRLLVRFIEVLVTAGGLAMPGRLQA